MAYINLGKSAQLIFKFFEPLQQDISLRIIDSENVIINMLDETEDVLQQKKLEVLWIAGRPAVLIP
ncbi:MAG: hypothetical protein LBV77_02395 [Candidatus Adiutrix intracellularis]|nr:hypothetical protein [Candidatus Adiutrix intracellularis]